MAATCSTNKRQICRASCQCVGSMALRGRRYRARPPTHPLSEDSVRGRLYIHFTEQGISFVFVPWGSGSSRVCVVFLGITRVCIVFSWHIPCLCRAFGRHCQERHINKKQTRAIGGKTRHKHEICQENSQNTTQTRDTVCQENTTQTLDLSPTGSVTETLIKFNSGALSR